MKNLKTRCILLLLFCGSIPQSFAQIDVTGYWVGNFGTHYYLRQIGNDLYGFYEANGNTVAGAFKARISPITQRAIFAGVPTGVFGNWYELPKAPYEGHDQFELELKTGRKFIQKSGYLPAGQLDKRDLPSSLPGDRPAGFTKPGIDGLWACNDGGKYYMAQVRDSVIWYGEKTDGRTTAFANVGFGKRTGNTIDLFYADVPKCDLTGQGNLRLQINGNIITKISGSGFGGSRWEKVVARAKVLPLANREKASNTKLKTSLLLKSTIKKSDNNYKKPKN